MASSRTSPDLLVSNKKGEIFNVPGLSMAGARGPRLTLPDKDELITFPKDTLLFQLPGRSPLAYDASKKQFTIIRNFRGEAVFAVAAFIPPGHVNLLNAAFAPTPDGPPLPLYSYTAVGWLNGKIVAAAKRVDPDTRQDFTPADLRACGFRAKTFRARFPGNRLVAHLLDLCLFRYGCPNARNLVLGRSEIPVPVSPVCNARCFGCLSLQKGREVPCAQDRIRFVPTAEEIIAYAAPHLRKADRAIVSFGQGCEGEPLLQEKVVVKAIQGLRAQTSRGTIHMNTNGSRPDTLRRLFEAGLDSVRVSLNSAQPALYKRYFKPVDYAFNDLLKSMKIARGLGKWCSVNYFIFPGFTDTPSETEAFIGLLRAVRPSMVQLRNLNMDPVLYQEFYGPTAFKETPFGLLEWMRRVKQSCPWIRYGSFNPPVTPD